MSTAEHGSTVQAPVIEFRNVSYRSSQGSTILEDISFTVAPGETLALLGRSGSGKTTALKLVNRLLLPSDGQVFVAGRSTVEWDPFQLRRSIGYVIQESGLFPHYTVERNIATVPRLEHWTPQRVAARIGEMMGLVGLDSGEFRRRYPHQLSGGQRQRVGVARALAADPQVLLMDEPFGALDPITRADLQQQFAELQRRLRKTIVLVTHDLREGLLLGSRIALLEAGKLAGLFKKEEFVSTNQPAVQRYIAPFRRQAALPI